MPVSVKRGTIKMLPLNFFAFFEKFLLNKISRLRNSLAAFFVLNTAILNETDLFFIL